MSKDNDNQFVDNLNKLMKIYKDPFTNTAVLKLMSKYKRKEDKDFTWKIQKNTQK